MAERMKGMLPLAAAVTIVAIVYCEIALNFTFHWATNGDLGNGLALPASFHFAVPAAFVAWALFFLVGGDGAAARKVAIGSVFGCVAALALFVFVDVIQGAPDFWALSLGIGLFAGVLVVLAALGDWYVIPVTFAAFAACVFWWIATGMAGWVPAATANTVGSLGDPATAGSGAFGGVLSTPYVWVVISCLFTLGVGILCGLASAKLSVVLTPKAKPATARRSERDSAVAAG